MKSQFSMARQLARNWLAKYSDPVTAERCDRLENGEGGLSYAFWVLYTLNELFRDDVPDSYRSASLEKLVARISADWGVHYFGTSPASNRCARAIAAHCMSVWALWSARHVLYPDAEGLPRPSGDIRVETGKSGQTLTVLGLTDSGKAHLKMLLEQADVAQLSKMHNRVHCMLARHFSDPLF